MKFTVPLCGINGMYHPKITLFVMLSLLSGFVYAVELDQRQAPLVEVFEVLSHGLGVNDERYDGGSLFLSKSSESDVEMFVSSLSEKPIKVEKGFSLGDRYRYVQAFYQNYFTVFTLGNEGDEWNGKLYSVRFTLRLPGAAVPAEETKTYTKISSMYGGYSKATKYMTSKIKPYSELKIYLWPLDEVVVTYRSFHDPRKRENVTVVECWDKTFFDNHNYRNY